jgi:hypothetical protein
MSNLKLWDAVSNSDPESLKQVSFGSRSFTAIDPQYQIMAVTKQFGPIGIGWGWTSTMEYIHFSDGSCAVTANVTVWHGGKDQCFGPFTGCRKFFDPKKGRIAEDAPKMAITDGLTKAISHMGFNADVFMGKMDGNKYADNNSQAPKGGEGW